MEIHQLVYFVAVAETGSFTRAAERCAVAQPSLSQQIIKLEHEIGQALFERFGRKVRLTDAGRVLLPRANAILAELQQIRSGLEQELQAGQGALAVGFIPTMAPFVLPQVIRRFRREFPQAALSVQEDFTENLVRGLVEGKLDVGIMSLPIQNRLIHTEELLSEPLLVASPAQHDAAARAALRVRELDQFPFIALSEVHCLGEQVQSFCFQQDVELQIVCQTAQLSTVQNCVALGLGVSLVPRALALCAPGEGLVYRPLSDALPQRKIAAASHAARQLSPLARAFVQMVREEYPA